MIRALILCALLAGVGGAECHAPGCQVIACYDRELNPKPCKGSIEEKIEKLEKRVAEIEKREKSASFRLSDEQIRAHNEKMFIMGCTSTDQPGCK